MSTAEDRQKAMDIGPDNPRHERRLLLELMAQVFDTVPVALQKFMPLRNVERTTLQELRATSTAHTALAPMVDELRRLGYAAEHTVGSVMDVLGLSQHDIHEMVCACHCGETMEGHLVGLQLRVCTVRNPAEGQAILQSYLRRIRTLKPSADISFVDALLEEPETVV